MVSDYCLICRLLVTGGKGILSNGDIYHTSCYKKILNDLNEDKQIFEDLNRKYVSILNSIKSAGSLKTKVKIFLGAEPPNIDKLHHQLLESERAKDAQRKILLDKKQQLRKIYDFWPNYPPDWDKRRADILNDSDSCEECGRYRNLHIHHKIRIGNGGSHKQSNLVVLCEKCHQKKHKKKKFNYTGNVTSYSTFDQTDSYFSKRLLLIKEVVSERVFIRFSYRKYNGTKSNRTIKPTHFEKMGESICIHGWCYLRNAKRVFAIKRMRRVTKITVEPQFKKRVQKRGKKPTVHKNKKKVRLKTNKKNKVAKKKTQQEEMIDQLDQHDLENLKLMGHNIKDN